MEAVRFVGPIAPATKVGRFSFSEIFVGDLARELCGGEVDIAHAVLKGVVSLGDGRAGKGVGLNYIRAGRRRHGGCPR